MATQDLDLDSEAYTNLILQPSKDSVKANHTRYEATKSTVKIPGNNVLFDIQSSGAASGLGPVGGIDKETKTEYAQEPAPSPPHDKKRKRLIQQVCRKFLYYGLAVDSTVLHVISAISSQQAVPTEETMEHTKQLLDYLVIQKEVVLTYSASNMTLAVHSNACYLNEVKTKSQVRSHFFSPITLTSCPTTEPFSTLGT